MSKIALSPARGAAIAMSLLLLIGCSERPTAAAPQRLTIEHAQGVTHVPRNPQTVMVFNPETLDMLDALEVKISGVPQTNAALPSFLAKYRGDDYLDVGTMFAPDYAALNDARPDPIFAGARMRDAYSKLSAVAPTLSLSIDSNNFIDSLTQRMEQLGAIFGKEQQARQRLEAFNQQVEQVKAKAAGAGSAMMLMIGGEKLYSYNPKSRFGFVFSVLGFEPAAVLPNEGLLGNVVTPEQLAQYNPDWLFVVSRDNAIGRGAAGAAQQALDNPAVHNTTAWRKNQIVYLDSSALYLSGGVQSYSRMMDDVGKALDQRLAH